MQFYDPVSKNLKAGYSEAIEKWVKEGNKITVLPSYSFKPKTRTDFDRDEPKATRSQINKLNNWLTAKTGRIALLGQLTGISNTYLSNIRRYLTPCNQSLFNNFERAMKAIEEDEVL
ncbi:hypothetical protein [Acinetobacter haemolyticus]|uniref:hypothetical protein n=1 Tax=Acinetobacter haemolyticus TaxID=29430 RepID=UPI000E570570|nr:hypothetical protein [Acinetobacter haemolyticus]QDJ91851.1 hypothetical protein AhaeAN54_007035 [Acinetobacter haemolyticus]